MKKIPIVFCFDDNWELAAGVCISSLLHHANTDTFYDIFILHSSTSRFAQRNNLRLLKSRYSNFNVTYRSVGREFEKAFEIRGITNSTYFRLLIPELIPEYDKIMYHDVDVIFRDDLSNIFEQTVLREQYVAGVRSTGGLNPEVKKYRDDIGLDYREYVLAGNIIINSRLMRLDGIVDRFKKEVSGSKYRFQDMDIINIVCKGKILFLPPVFCATVQIFELNESKAFGDFYVEEELNEAVEKGIIHFNGAKPWIQCCLNSDIWWYYYRLSPFYESSFVLSFHANNSNAGDRLSLFQRIKLVFRYFKARNIKS